MPLNFNKLPGGGPIGGDPEEPSTRVRLPIVNAPRGGEISGASTSGSIAASAAQIEEFAAEGGRALPIVYGVHIVAGILIVHKYTVGTPNVSIIYVALGEGRGGAGGVGEWNAALKVYYNGEELSVSPDASTEGYRFYKGFISTGIADPNQPVDAFLSGGLAYSGTAYIAVKLPDEFANAEDRPDKLKGKYQGRKTLDFNNVGGKTAYDYSTNPARVAVDRIFSYYDHKFGTDPDRALVALQEKVDWEPWRTWADFNIEEIDWDDGTTVRNIPRFECNIAFTDDLILADALDQICATAGAFWQDDGEQLIFLPPTDRTPVHHFDESNIIQGSIAADRRDLRDRPNYIIAEFRDQDDEFLGLSSVKVRRETLIKQAGEIKSERAFTTMTQSQAERLAERQARLESDNPEICSLTGDETALHILPGDFVTLSHPLVPWPAYQRCLVLSVEISSAEDAPDTCTVTLQKVEDALYSDTAHTQRQEPLDP